MRRGERRFAVVVGVVATLAVLVPGVRTLVDGEPWHARSSLPLRPAPGASWTGRGTDRIYTVCTPADSTHVASHNLAEGDHEVSMRASLPGTSLDLVSDVVPASLRCVLP